MGDYLGAIYYNANAPGWDEKLAQWEIEFFSPFPFTPWGKYVPITSDQGTHTDTGNWLGNLEITHDPWVWCEMVPCWFNIPEQSASAGNGWVHVPPSEESALQIVQIDGTDWGYSFALNKWLYLTADGWVYMM
jgi:hypothetical protein